MNRQRERRETKEGRREERKESSEQINIKDKGK